MLSCGKCESAFKGNYSEAYDQWEECARIMPVPVHIVALTNMHFDPQSLNKGFDLTKNSDILEIA